MTLANQLEREEGRVLHAYRDSLGYWTIGVGRMIDARKGGGISNAECDLLLANDIAVVEAEVLARAPWVAGLDEARRAALYQMAFQLGTPGLLRFKETMAAMQSGDFERAAMLALRSVWAIQTPERAARVAEQLRTGTWI